MPAAPAPTQTQRRSSQDLWELATKVLTVVAGGITWAAFVAVIGGALLWVRLQAAGLPGTQAVALVNRTELVTTGLATLIPFTLAALGAIFLMYLVDPEACVDIELGPREGARPQRRAAAFARRFLTGVRSAWGRAAILIMLELGAFYAVGGFNSPGRGIAAGALALTLLPLGPLASWSGPPALRAVAALILAGAFAAILSQEPTPTVVAWGCALAGAVVSLAVAALTPGFRSFAVTAFVAISVFGAVTSYVRTDERPKVQPAALLLDDGRIVTGFYVGQNDHRIYLGAVTPQVPAPRHRDRCRQHVGLVRLPDGTTGYGLPPEVTLDQARELVAHPLRQKGRPRSGRIVSVERDHVASLATGNPMSICDALDREQGLGLMLLRDQPRSLLSPAK